MSTKEGRTREFSLSTMTELVLPNDTNIIGNLLGGRLLHWIDIAGALTATRHAGGIVATLTMDTVEFRYPVKMGCIVTLVSYMTWTGKTSMETAVEVYAEDARKNTRQMINKVYLVFIALDDDGNKREIAPYVPETEEELAEFEAGTERQRIRKQRGEK